MKVIIYCCLFRHIRPVLAVVMALMVLFPVFSQNVMSVSDISKYALENSREIQTAEDNLAEARETISEVFTLDESRLTVSSDYAYAAAAAETPNSEEQHAVNVDGSVTVPIIPELSLSANVGYPVYTTRKTDDWNLTGGLSLKYTPFGDPSTDWQEWEILRKAEIALEHVRNTVPLNAEIAALNIVKGQLELQAAETAMELAEREYEIDKKRYELDDITYSDLEESRTEASSTRQSYYNTLKSLFSLKKNLYQIIGPDLGDIEVRELSTGDVLDLVAKREAELKNAEAGQTASVSLLNLAVEIEALKQELEETPVFQPSLTLSGNMNFNDFRAGGGVSLSLSPEQFQTEERDDLLEEIADVESDLVLEQANVDLEVGMLKQSISIAREALQISISDYDNYQIQYDETKLLHERGERTDLELERSGLDLFFRSITVFSSAVDLYRNLGDLLIFYLLD